MTLDKALVPVIGIFANFASCAEIARLRMATGWLARRALQVVTGCHLLPVLRLRHSTLTALALDVSRQDIPQPCGARFEQLAERA